MRRRLWLLALAAGLAVSSVGVLLAVQHVMPTSGRGGTEAAASRGAHVTTPQATASATPMSAPASVAPPPVPAHFGTLPPGAALPSGTLCAAWVRANPIAENKGMNRVANQTTGAGLGGSFFPGGDDPRANRLIAPRVNGQFTGTTHEILRWAACKWGIDENVVAAQAAVESWWDQTFEGDWTSDATTCPAGHGPGADGQPGQCPQSYGIVQNKWEYEKSSWPGIRSSTAMNVDTAYAIWRACYEGYEPWLNDTTSGQRYGAGDVWGCVGRWFAGDWHSSDGESYMNQRIWEQPRFQQT